MCAIQRPLLPNVRRRRTACAALLALVVAAWTPALSAKHADDRLVLANGDHFVGEIKKLAHGELHFKTDYIVDEF